MGFWYGFGTVGGALYEFHVIDSGRLVSSRTGCHYLSCHPAVSMGAYSSPALSSQNSTSLIRAAASRPFSSPPICMT